jgi:hypothetical protein
LPTDESERETTHLKLRQILARVARRQLADARGNDHPVVLVLGLLGVFEERDPERIGNGLELRPRAVEDGFSKGVKRKKSNGLGRVGRFHEGDNGGQVRGRSDSKVTC